MPWFRQPIPYDLIQPDPSGPIRMALHAYVPMEFELTPRIWTPIRRAVIDSGASLCIFSAQWARANGFRLPTTSSRLPVVTATGTVRTRVYDVDLNARF